MVVFIAATYPVAKSLTENMYNKFNLGFCAIEAEYGNGKLSQNDIGVVASYNHHTIGDDYYQPCLAFQDDTIAYENFIVSHIDIDTILGIGWLSGMFHLTYPRIFETLKDISIIASVNDNFGFHNVPIMQIEKYRKEWDVISSYVVHAKNMINKSKFKNYYNCTSIIQKTLKNIIKALMHKEVLEAKHKLIKFDSSNIQVLPESNDIIKFYNKKINNFENGAHQFICVKNYGLSIYGRDYKTVKKYFPEGLNIFLSNLIPGSGGHFNASGTPRKQRISNEDYLRIVSEINKRLDYGS